MAQYKVMASVNHDSQTVTIGIDATMYIKAKDIFMVEGELVPYFVAADPTWNGTVTTVQLTGKYVGPNRTDVDVVFVTDFTYPDNIPVISQGDVGTAAIFSNAMYKIQDMIKTVAPTGLAQYTDLRDQCVTAATTATAAAAAADAAAAQYAEMAAALVATQAMIAEHFAFS